MGRRQAGRLLRVWRVPPHRPAAGHAARGTGWALQLRGQLDQLLPALRPAAPDRPVAGPGGPRHVAGQRSPVNPTVGTLAVQRPELALATLLAITPVLLVFLFSQRFRVSGTLAGATEQDPRPAWNGEHRMPPVITASVPLLEPPDWAIAQRQLFTLLDHAWRQFEDDFTGPDWRLNYGGPLTSRDGVDDFYETFFNWPQLYLLAAPTTCSPHRNATGRSPGSSRTRHAARRVRARLRRFHQSESMPPCYFRPAAPQPPGPRHCASPTSTSTRHGNYDPHAPHYPPPAQRQRPTAEPACSTARTTHGYPTKASGTVFHWTGCCSPGTDEPPRERDPRLGEQMRRRIGVGDTASTSPLPASSATP